MEKYMSRIFIFGDSFAANLYEEYYYNIKVGKVITHPIEQYLVDLREENIDDALWFSDWLQKFGYEVYNYGIPGADNQTIIEQFHKLKNDHKEGDRIIVWYSSLLRYQWFLDNGERYSITPNFPPLDSNNKITDEYFMKQCSNRYLSSTKSYIKKTHVEFLDYFLCLHSNYNPIITSFCADTKKILSKNKYFLGLDYVYSGDLVKTFKSLTYTMNDESGGKIDDRHFSRETNYIHALIYDEIIKNDVTKNYNTNIELLDKVKKRLLVDKIEFKIPKKWNKNYGEKKIFTDTI
jgi:hypothetical protein